MCVNTMYVCVYSCVYMCVSACTYLLYKNTYYFTAYSNPGPMLGYKSNRNKLRVKDSHQQMMILKHYSLFLLSYNHNNLTLQEDKLRPLQINFLFPVHRPHLFHLSTKNSIISVFFHYFRVFLYTQVFN